MLGYISRRLFALLPVLIVVSIVIFSIAHLTPGDPATGILGPEASAEDLARLRDSMGLNEPVLTQYFTWVASVLTGDFGDSIFLHMPVLQAITANFMPTLQLALMGLSVTLLLSIPLGTLAARYRGSPFDHAVMGMTLIGMAVPSFVLGLALIIVFAVILKVLPVAGYVSPMTDLAQSLRYMILPAVSLGTILAALLTRITRAAVLDVLHSDYIDSARSRGVSERRLLFVHTLRNAGLPIMTTVGLTFGGLITGAVITETIFNIPGIGSLLINAITRRDYPMIQGVVLFVTLAYLFVNLVVDILYVLVDPRVRPWK